MIAQFLAVFSTYILVDYPHLDRGGLRINAAKTADGAKVTAKSTVFEDQTHADRQAEKGQQHPARHARIRKGQGAEQADQQESARLQPGAFQAFRPAQVQAQAFSLPQDAALLKPVAGQWNGAETAPGPPPKGYEGQLECAPPSDPDEDDGEIMAAYDRTEQSGRDGKDKTRQRQRPYQELRPGAFDQRA